MSFKLLRTFFEPSLSLAPQEDSLFHLQLLFLCGDVERNPGPPGRREPKPDKAKSMADKVEAHDAKFEELDNLIKSQAELIESLTAKQVELEKSLTEKQVELEKSQAEKQVEAAGKLEEMKVAMEARLEETQVRTEDRLLRDGALKMEQAQVERMAQEQWGQL